MLISRTPYRLSFFGGGTDYPSWYMEHGGATLGCTIDKYCRIGVRQNNLFGARYKVVYSKVESCETLADIQHLAVRECLKFLAVAGAEIYHWSDLPARSGVGSSSAFVVGLLLALRGLTNKFPSIKYPYDLANTLAIDAMEIEQKLLQETVGSQDQVLCAYGGFNILRFTSEGFTVRAVLKDGYPVRPQNNNLMLFYTGLARTSSDVAATYLSDFPKHKSVMNRLKEMVDEGRDALQVNDFNNFGKLLGEAWSLKKRLGANITNGTIDAIYDSAIKAGAIGGKLLGAGGGGFLLFSVPIEYKQTVSVALKDLIEVPFNFEYEGAQLVHNEGI